MHNGLLGIASYWIILTVAPLAGAWIETRAIGKRLTRGMSRPSRARGLKPAEAVVGPGDVDVAPLAGAWIETHVVETGSPTAPGRAPRGRVD